jgi:hypothetical protein
MRRRIPRKKLLLTLVGAQLVCLAAGFWIHHWLVVSTVRQAAEGLEAISPPGASDALASACRLPLLGAGTIAWVWTGAMLIVACSLILGRLFEEVEKSRTWAEAENLKQIQSLVRTRDALIFGLASLAESRDEATARHVERVSCYASRLAIAAGGDPKFRKAITPEFIEQIGIASVLHDIGKVGIGDAILFKPGRLTDAERQRMQQHSTIGGNHLSAIEQRLGNVGVIRMAREIARWHHERWDGGGYPDGLAGEQTPLAARIVAIADVYEALNSVRDYKPSYPHEQCVEIIRRDAGKHFDPDLVQAFLKIEDSFRQINYQYGEERFRAAPCGEQPESASPLAPAGALDSSWCPGSPAGAVPPASSAPSC